MVSRGTFGTCKSGKVSPEWVAGFAGIRILGRFPAKLGEKSIIWISEKMKMVLEELLINAMKYSKDHDDIFILIAYEEPYFGIRILNPAYTNQDGTIGITPQNEHKIFEPFFRLSSVVDDRFIEEVFRFGLGLTIVRKIIDLHNASISLYTVKSHIRENEKKNDICAWLRFTII